MMTMMKMNLSMILNAKASFSILSFHYSNLIVPLGESSPAYQNHYNPTNNHAKSEQIDIVKDPSTDKADVHLIHDGVHDTEINVAIPSNDLLQAITSSPPSTCGFTPKTKISFSIAWNIR